MSHPLGEIAAMPWVESFRFETLRRPAAGAPSPAEAMKRGWPDGDMLTYIWSAKVRGHRYGAAVEVEPGTVLGIAADALLEQASTALRHLENDQRKGLDHG